MKEKGTRFHTGTTFFHFQPWLELRLVHGPDGWSKTAESDNDGLRV